jgi:hypothetical protein
MKTLSELTRALQRIFQRVVRRKNQVQLRNGVPLMPPLPKGSAPLTMETVNRLRDEID